jgi:hypothetical protein
MPSPSEILDGLTTISNHWRGVAITWHVLFGMLVLGLVSGWRPTERLLAVLITLPLLSVSILAWSAENAFNGAIFTGLALALFRQVPGLRPQRVRFDSPGFVVPGAALVAFGWMYPHFLKSDTWAAYAYAAPLGVVPCATLSAVMGIAWMVAPLRSGVWAAALASCGLLYGALGVSYLNVTMDAVLLVGALALAISASRVRTRQRQPRATRHPSQPSASGAVRGDSADVARS